MVAVYSFCPSDISVVVVHGYRPFVAVSILSGAHGTFWILDCHVESVYLHMSFPVVAGFLLCFSWILFYFRTCSFYAF